MGSRSDLRIFITGAFWITGIENTFLEKLVPWSAEQEWRIVHVNFQETMPEDRILHFNNSALTGVYFGAKASELTQKRVKNILDKEKQHFVLQM